MQKILIEFLSIFGIERKKVATFEHKVKKLCEASGYIDLLWPGMLLVEMKSRGENLEKAYTPSYLYKIKTARCIIPVTGIFEHREIKGWKNKVPYHVQLKNRDVFALPELYHYPNRADVETGEVTGTFTIITRSAKDLMKQIHNSGEQAFRMPLFLTKELEIKWLSPTLTDTDLAEILDFEMPSSSLSYIPVYTIRTTRERPEQQIKTAEYLWEGLTTTRGGLQYT